MPNNAPLPTLTIPTGAQYSNAWPIGITDRFKELLLTGPDVLDADRLHKLEVTADADLATAHWVVLQDQGVDVNVPQARGIECAIVGMSVRMASYDQAGARAAVSADRSFRIAGYTFFS